jgi:hypothetical protein
MHPRHTDDHGSASHDTFLLGYLATEDYLTMIDISKKMGRKRERLIFRSQNEASEMVRFLGDCRFTSLCSLPG